MCWNRLGTLSISTDPSQIANNCFLTGGQVVQTDMVACRRGFARRRSQLPNDDSLDDNRDDCGPLNYTPYSLKMALSR